MTGWFRQLNTMFRFVVLALAVASASAGLVLPRLPLSLLLRGNVELVDPTIVGGTPASPGEFPWQVSLRRSSDSGSAHFCGGSVLNADTIITAAHCTDGTNANRVHVAAGAHTLNDNTGVQVVVAASLNEHPQYNANTINNDISIIKLSSSLSLNSRIQGVALPAAGDETSAGTSLTVTGWGTTSSGGSLSNTLLKVSVPVVSDAECRRAYGQTAIADSMLCAGVGGKDSCQGDSGGPLTNSAGELIGVVSWGRGCALDGYPGVYTQVSYFISFINQFA